MSTAAGEWGYCGGGEFWQRLREHMLGAQTSRAHRARGAGFGPWGAWGWGGAWNRPPERPRAARGDVRLAILALLAESPHHGYQLMQDIADRSHGAWTPSPGSVYPALSALQDEGLVDDEKVEGRRVFSLTPGGEDYVAAHGDEIGGVFTPFTDQQPAGAEDLKTLMMSVAGAAMQVIAAGKFDEAERILVRTRRELFAVLAADEER